MFWSVQTSEEELEISGSEHKKQSSKKRRCKKKQKKSSDRICVNFNGFRKFLKQSDDVFKVQCDRRQLPILQQIVTDWQAYHQLPDEKKYSLGLMVLKTAQLLWNQDDQKLYKKMSKRKASTANESHSEQPIEPWQSHRLYLHFTIDPRLLTAEGTETVRQEKITETGKKLDGLKKAMTEQLRKDIELSKGSEDSAKKQKNREDRIRASTSSLTALQQPTPKRPNKLSYQSQPHILVGVSFNREQPVGVVVMDMTTQKVVEYQSVRQLLSNRTIKVKRGNRSATQLRLEKYRLISRHHRQQQKNAARRTQEQKQNRYAESNAESNLGEYVDRLLASRIVKLALKWQASSIALPKIGDIRESIESDIKVRAQRKFPNEFERQQRYAKHFRNSIHRWSYSRLAEGIKSCASKVAIPVELGQQPAEGTLQEKAAQVALSAYYTREAPKS
ncbi:type V CRISPR-associated protein Cas12k [Trichocoleus desertorum AS-A10]|uniref:type V CRISPR-associated protein Cas12k n=1 Tax=Trichocoleus desertorum TaxID=1481672 RepID=UPI00329A55B3